MVKQCVPMFGRALLAVFVAAGTARAQEAGFTKDFKVRTAWSPSSRDQLRASSLGYGLDLGFRTGIGTLGLEVGYYYKGGDSYLEPVAGQAPSPLEPVDLAHAGDSRRNELDGLSLRLSLRRPLNPTWSWQVGLMAGGTRFRHEYFGDVRGENWESTNPHSWRDTYSGTPVEGGLKVSPYVGLTCRISKISSVEFNLMALSYTALDHRHHPGTGVYAQDTDPESDPTAGLIAPHNAFPGDTLSRTRRFVPHLEFGYVFHF